MCGLTGLLARTANENHGDTVLNTRILLRAPLKARHAAKAYIQCFVFLISVFAGTTGSVFSRVLNSLLIVCPSIWGDGT